MDVLTFEQLPEAVSNLFAELRTIKELLNSRHTKTEDPAERLLSVDQTAEFLNLSKPTIYSKVSRGELPVMKRGKRLYFSNLELLEYIKEGRRKTPAEVKAEVESFLSDNKKRVAK